MKEVNTQSSGLPWLCNGYDPGLPLQEAQVSVPGQSTRSHMLCRVVKNKQKKTTHLRAHQFSSVAQSCPTLCDSMNSSTPDLPVHQLQSLLKLMSIESVMPSTISSSVIPFSSCLQSFPASGSFQISQFFASGGHSIGVSALASVFQSSSLNSYFSTSMVFPVVMYRCES